MIKRILDILLATLGLIILAPAFVIIPIVIRCESPGPVFYRATRLGRQGRLFEMLKFRTMVAHAEHLGQPATPEGDPRVTRVGAVLRKFKLDEVPQLLNVLMGEMSIVGPRPEAALYFAYYDPEIKNEILSVRPGITDYGSLYFHDEGKLIVSDDPVRAYVERVLTKKIELQLKYIRSRSIVVDVKIMVLTVLTILITRFRKDPPPDGIPRSIR